MGAVMSERSVTLVLPLPSPLLTPNVRMHWRERARHVKAQRQYALWAVPWDTAVEELFDGAQRIRLDVEIRPRPRMKRHDDDNLWAALKATRDGIADALGVDDKQFVSGSLTWSTERSGLLVVTLTAARAEAAPGAGGDRGEGVGG